MNDFYVFNKTVQGHSHITKNIQCEDSSISFKDENNLYYIFAISDGHGDKTCFRSDKGSKFATEVTYECLKEFSDYYVQNPDELYKRLENVEEQKQTIKQLTDTLICRWNERIEEDIQQNTISEQEIDTFCKDNVTAKEIYLKGERLNHIYGATLIAGLKILNYLILIQQGDGRCILFDENGDVSQPIPWDNRCESNVTTSMCDNDVFTSIRHKIIDLDPNPISACFVCSDGIEDSFIGMEGTYSFFRKECMDIIHNSKIFEEELPQTLSYTSANGSGDDMSVAGIVNTEAITQLMSFFESKNKKYDLYNEQQKIKKLIDSKTRKHDILIKQKEEIDEGFNNISRGIQDLINNIEEYTKSIQLIDEQISFFENKIDELQNETEEEYDNEVETNLDNVLPFIGIIDKMVNSNKKIENDCEEQIKDLLKDKEKISAQLDEKTELLNKYSEQFEQIKEQKEQFYDEFNEYDSTYNDLLEKYNNISAQINDIEN